MDDDVEAVPPPVYRLGNGAAARLGGNVGRDEVLLGRPFGQRSCRREHDRARLAERRDHRLANALAAAGDQSAPTGEFLLRPCHHVLHSKAVLEAK